MKLPRRACLFLTKCIYGAAAVLFTVILGVVLKNPQNNLIPLRMLLYTLFWACILLCIRFVLEQVLKQIKGMLSRKNVGLKTVSNCAFAVFLAAYGVLLYYVSLRLRAEPITDYKSVYDTAYALASGQPVEDWSYFAVWTNNTGVLSVLAFCMRVGIGLGFEDPYYFVLAVNVLQVMAAFCAVFYLAGRMGGGRVSCQWMSAAVFALWTPLWGYTSAFYSDQLSFGGSVVGTALLVLGCSVRGRRRWLCAAGGGLVWGIAVSVKITAAIPLIALAAAALLGVGKLCGSQPDTGRPDAGQAGAGAVRRQREILVFGLVFLAAVGGLTAVNKSYPSRELEERLRVPSDYWVALGLLGKGTYADNEEFVTQCIHEEQSIEQRRVYCREVIAENWKNIFDVRRMGEKASVIFGAGDIAPTSLAYPYEDNFLWQLLYWKGQYFWKYICTSTSFFDAVMLFMAVGAASALRDRRGNMLALQAYMAVFGLFIFLMAWEAQNKQLYNHIPWMTLAAGAGIERVYGWGVRLIGRGRMENVDKA